MYADRWRTLIDVIVPENVHGRYVPAVAPENVVPLPSVGSCRDGFRSSSIRWARTVPWLLLLRKPGTTEPSSCVTQS